MCQSRSLNGIRSLNSYEQEEIRTKVYDEIIRYSGVMMGRLFRDEKGEKTYVQTEIRDLFWANTRDCLKSRDLVLLTNEQS